MADSYKEKPSMDEAKAKFTVKFFSLANKDFKTLVQKSAIVEKLVQENPFQSYTEIANSPLPATIADSLKTSNIPIENQVFLVCKFIFALAREIIHSEKIMDPASVNYANNLICAFLKRGTEKVGVRPEMLNKAMADALQSGLADLQKQTQFFASQNFNPNIKN